MKMKKTWIFLSISILLLTACESGPRVQMAPGFEQTTAPIDSQANVLGTPVPTLVPPTPTVPPLVLDNTLYTDPSRTLSFYPPLGWDLITETEGYVKFTRSDGTAWFEGAVESTGYTIKTQDYLVYVDSLLDSLYGNTKDYQLIERKELEDRIIVSSSFMKGEQQWYAMDFFLQRDRAVYALSFQAHESVWNEYKDRFSQIINRVQTQTGYLKDDLLYIFRKSHKAPGGGFQIFIPLGWSLTLDQETYPDGVIEVISSPDGEANIEITALDAARRLANTDIGQVSIAILKERISRNLKIVGEDVLLDGRIRIDWRVDNTGEAGSTFFWVNGKLMYILTYRYTNDHAGLYRSLLFNIGDSLNFIDPAAAEAQ
jgi:hypothetical protein